MESNAAPMAVSYAITLVAGQSDTARAREAAGMAAQTGTAQTGTAQTGTGPDARQFDGGTGPETVITVSGLFKRYGDVEAVRVIDSPRSPRRDLRLPRPERRGLQVHHDQDPLHARERDGRDGHRGQATTPRPNAIAVRRNIGLVFQDTTLDTYLTAEQNLRFHAELYGVPKACGCCPGCARCWRWWACGTARTAW